VKSLDSTDNHSMLNASPQEQGFGEHELVSIALLAGGLGVAIAGSLRELNRWLTPCYFSKRGKDGEKRLDRVGPRR
ncbi:MAG: hypothetical protein NTY01_04795, partial [Verrucomicrobia bacterium]|nr:hypothetical protein [Verrucomicrobiota bacterium]